MDPLQRRAALFLLGCIPTRAAFVWLTATYTSYLPWFGALALLPAMGFLYFYFSGTRNTGLETGGAPIWWAPLRPVHALFWAAFAVAALFGFSWAWMILAADTLFGICAFLVASPARAALGLSTSV